MKQFVVILVTLAVVNHAASQGYKYQLPQRQQIQPIRPPQPQANVGVYSGLPTASAPPAISLPPPFPAPLEPAPAPISQPQQTYLPPQQQQQQQHVQQFSQQQQYQQQQSFQAVPSIPQGHQQQIVQQQLSQPIQNSGYQNFQSVQRPQSAIITKDIFIHSAPEDQDIDLASGPQYDAGPARKNYRIVFIKAPTQNLRGAAAALKRAQANNEEKTIIYVLSKKPDLSEVQQHLQQAQGEQKVNKPEVYFIKYKTQEEAQRAQQEIQAQYDALGGSTHISDEGIAPVTTVGGASSGALNLSGPISAGTGTGTFSQNSVQQQSFAQQSFQSQGGGSISQKYLPAKAFKK